MYQKNNYFCKIFYRNGYGNKKSFFLFGIGIINVFMVATINLDQKKIENH